MRILMISHGHPRFSKGGAEIAAMDLAKALRATGKHDVLFVGRSPGGKLQHTGTVFSGIAPNELLLQSEGEWFLQNQNSFGQEQVDEWIEMLKGFNPDVVHFQHYAHMGVELLRVTKTACPTAKIVLTLHEYMAMCANNGQMIKTTNGALCYKSDPKDCHRCYPNHSPEDFFLRERYIKQMFTAVDLFISPSEFLRQRYIDWGLAPEQIIYLENGQVPAQRIPSRALGPDEGRTRFAYYGQINPYKGVDVILEAVKLLPKDIKKKVSVDIYGGGLEQQEEAYREKVNKLIKDSKQQVRYHGAYEAEDMPRLMADVDWVVMGSIWWENSPLVIQEAYKFGRPVICPDIGGMAEKVKDGVTGLHYRARDPASLALAIEKCVRDATLWDGLCGNLPVPVTVEYSAKAHYQAYRSDYATLINPIGEK